ncbi:MAG: hypothetical protein NTW51_10840 [Cyanobacteria bacterium]|nr:hypothetical protein [Cyanobacteriota bacterium]
MSWAGFQGLEHRFGWIGGAVGIYASQYFRNCSNPILIAAYLHAMKAWSWRPEISALFATSSLVLMMIDVYFSLPIVKKPAWGVELISLLIFALMLCLNIAVLAAGFEGIENGMGLVWAVVAVAALMCRFSIGLFGIGACFQVANDWGWNPVMAVLFAAGPSICFLIGCRLNQTLFLGPLPFLNQIRRWN